jgi:hypothetical protein
MRLASRAPAEYPDILKILEWFRNETLELHGKNKELYRRNTKFKEDLTAWEAELKLRESVVLAAIRTGRVPDKPRSNGWISRFRSTTK